VALDVIPGLFRLFEGHGGQGLAELVLVLPVLLMIAGVALDFGRLFAYQITVSDAARQGARYLAQNPSDESVPSPCSPSFGGTIATVEKEAQGSPVDISCSDITASLSGPDGFGYYIATVKVSVPFHYLTPLLSGLAPPTSVSATATAQSAPETAQQSSSCNTQSQVLDQAGYEGLSYAVATSDLVVNGTRIPDQVLISAGPLASAGGNNSQTVLSGEIPQVLSTTAQSEQTNGANFSVNSASQGVQVSLLPGAGPGGSDLVDVNGVSSQASSTYSNGSDSFSSSSSVSSITVDGVSVLVPQGENQVVNVNNVAIVTFNQTVSYQDAIEVNAVSIYFPPSGALASEIVGTIDISGTIAGYSASAGANGAPC